MSDSIYKTECYLVIGLDVREYHYEPKLRAHSKPKFRVAIKRPATSKTEIAIKLNLGLPLALFTRPELTASVIVPEEKQPYKIDADVQHRIAEAVRESTGLDVRVSVEAAAQ
jgi:hypothetical protein